MKKRDFEVQRLGEVRRPPQRPASVPQELERSGSVAEPCCTGELGFMRPPAVETCNVGAACPESLPLVGASPAGSPPSPRDLPEPRRTAEHTNNRIGESACLGRAVGGWVLGPRREPETLGPEGPQGGGVDSPTGLIST